jgi:hypothetical protein
MPETPRTTLTDGRQVYPEHRNLKENGQQQDYVVLAEERSKGFVRPVRNSYKHLKCGSVTRIGQTLAETYARDPNFYRAAYSVWGVVLIFRSVRTASLSGTAQTRR